MQKRTKRTRIISIVLALILVLGLFPAPVLAAENESTITVYMSFEGYNLGQGFYIAPTALTLPAGATAEDATRMLLNQEGHAFVAFGTGASFYLSRVSGFDTGVINPPPFIDAGLLTAGSGDGSLGEFDYSFSSGWMITVNHEIIPVGAGSQVLQHSDVIRWQFSVQGFGEDLGISSPLYAHADKTALIRALFAGEVDTAAQQTALDVIIDPLATVQAVDAALEALQITTTQPDPDAFWFEVEAPSSAADLVSQLNAVLMSEFGQASDAFDYSAVRNLNISGTIPAGLFRSGEFVNVNNAGYMGLSEHLVRLDLSGVTSNIQQLGVLSPNQTTMRAYVAVRHVTIPSAFAQGNAMGQLMFGNMSALETVRFVGGGTLPNGIGQNWFVGTPNLRELTFEQATAPTIHGTGNPLETVIAYVPDPRVGGYELSAFYTRFAEVRSLGGCEVIGEDVSFIRVPFGTRVGVFQKGNRHFAAFQSFALTPIPALSTETHEVYAAELPLNVTLHIEAYTYGETVKRAQFIQLTAHGTTIAVTPTPLSEWIPGRGTAWMDANVLTNLDDSGTINLTPGESFYLDTFRVWQAKAGVTENYFIEPVYTFDLFGDNVEIARAGSPGRERLRITALRPGTSVIRATYGPVEYVQTNGSTLFFDAMDPRNTLAVVVNVSGGADFDTGITARNDFDTYFFDAAVGYRTFTFTPASGSSVRVHSPLNISPWGSGWTTYAAASDGSFTVRLRDGRNIIEIRNGGAVRYHAVMARGVSVTVVNETNPGKPFAVGDTARIELLGLQEPIEKLAGIYNPGIPGFAMWGEPDLRAFVQYTDGTQSVTGNRATQYQTAVTTFTVRYTLTDTAQNVLNGQIFVGAMGSVLGAHRNIPLVGAAPNFTAVHRGPYPFGALPEIILPLAGEEPEPIDYITAMNAALGWIRAHTTNPTVDSIGGEWAVLALARAGVNDQAWFNRYLENLARTLPHGAGLHADSWTDHARVTLALSALGLDASNHRGHDLTAPFRTFVPANQRHNRNVALNADIWALIALDARPYPGNRQALVQSILDAQQASGAWGLTMTKPTIDITAMAIQALAPYYAGNPAVRTAVSHAFAWLETQTIADAEGNAQMIVALSALGRDAERYVEALLTFFHADTGAFMRNEAVNTMATEQAAYALAAHHRFQTGQNRLYDMSDAADAGGNEPGETGLAVNRSALLQEIARAEARFEEHYTSASWAVKRAALVAAGWVAADANAGQVQVDMARDTLHAAINALVRIDTGGGLRAFISVIDPNAGPGQTRVFFAGRYLEFQAGDTVYDLLRSTGLTIEARGPATDRYVERINGFGEFDAGPLSGWMYRVNSVFPDRSASQVVLRDGDRVEWLFTRNLGNDLDAELGTGELEEEETAQWTNPFSDVVRGRWYYNYVKFAYVNGLKEGTASGQFSPDMNLSRAMLVTILWRLEGEPTVTGSNTFSDVRPGRWYSNAIAWAGANELVHGYGDGRFGPADHITREQFAVILRNYAQFAGQDTAAGAFQASFTDADTISDWALDAMQWANANGLIHGRTPTSLAPRGTATRAEAAAILQRFMEAS